MQRVVLFLTVCSFALIGCKASVEGEFSVTAQIGGIEKGSEVSNTSDEDFRREQEHRREVERQRDELLQRERARVSEHLKEQISQKAEEVQSLEDEVRRLKERKIENRRAEVLRAERRLEEEKRKFVREQQRRDEEEVQRLEENEQARNYEPPLRPYEPAYVPDPEWRPVIQHSQRARQAEQSDGGVQKTSFFREVRRVEPSVEINITSEEVLMDSILIKDATNEEMVYPESPHWYGFTTDAPVIWVRVWGARQRSNRLKLRVRDGEVVAVDVVQEVDRLRLGKTKQKRIP